MDKAEALKLALEVLESYKGFIEDAHIIEGQWHWIDGASNAITAIKQALAAPTVQEPVAWVPYLSDRADGVQGHYAIARWNPRGYREVWNLRRHAWGAFSDDVMSLEEADYLLQQITIPTRKPTPPAAQPAPDCKETGVCVQTGLACFGQAAPVQEPVAWMTINAYGEEDDIWYENPEGHLIEGWTYKPLYTTPPASHEKDCVPCVVVTTSSGVFIQLPEDAARKLADDILRNANYLWPMDEENT